MVKSKRGVRGTAKEGGVGFFPVKRRGVLVELDLFFQLVLRRELKIGVEMGDKLFLLSGLRAEVAVGVAIREREREF